MLEFLTEPLEGRFKSTRKIQHMKYCPTCSTRYDEEILRFCMKDGTPLISEEEPNFIQMPSESPAQPAEDDPSEVTVIRRGPTVPPPPDDEESFAPSPRRAERIVVPTVPEPRPQVEMHRVPYTPPAPQPNTAKIVFLTILGTLAVLAVAAAGIYVLQNDSPANASVNVNTSMPNLNANIGTNAGAETNFNFSAASNFNTSSAPVSNTKTPTPTPTPKPSPSPTPTATPDEEATPEPTRSPMPSRTPLPSPEPTLIRPTPPKPPANRPDAGGVLNGRALSLAKPAYPAAARQIGASGPVAVEVIVDQRGNVIAAKAVSGHPLLRRAAEDAARQSKVRPADNQLSGLLLYNFKNN